MVAPSPPRSDFVFIFNSTATIGRNWRIGESEELERFPLPMKEKVCLQGAKKDAHSEPWTVLSLTQGWCGKQLGGLSRTIRGKKRSQWNCAMSRNGAVSREVWPRPLLPMESIPVRSRMAELRSRVPKSYELNRVPPNSCVQSQSPGPQNVTRPGDSLYFFNVYF